MSATLVVNCPECNGRGARQQMDLAGRIVYRSCPDCEGTGRVDSPEALARIAELEAEVARQKEVMIESGQRYAAMEYAYNVAQGRADVRDLYLKAKGLEEEVARLKEELGSKKLQKLSWMSSAAIAMKEVEALKSELDAIAVSYVVKCEDGWYFTHPSGDVYWEATQEEALARFRKATGLNPDED